MLESGRCCQQAGWQSSSSLCGKSHGTITEFVLRDRSAGPLPGLTFVAGVGVFAILSAIGYAPTQSAVLANQPTTLIPFLLDLIIGGWLAAGIAEEFFFRGFLLAKFRQAFGAGRIGLICAVIAQAVWFGAAHASQGLSGVVAISFLAVVLAVFFLTRANKTLVPLMIGHAFVDTISLTSNYLTQ